MTGQEILDEVLSELGALADTDLNDIGLNGINWARREIENLRGGKLRWLRKVFTAINTVAGTSSITFSTDLRVIRLLWNRTEDAEVEYKAEAPRRGAQGVQLSTDTRGEPTSFSLDIEPDAVTGALRAELWPVPDAVYSLQPLGYRRLARIAAASLSAEILDMPSHRHEALVTGARLYCIRRLPRAGDLLADARAEWQSALHDITGFDQDTTLESLRIRSQAELDRMIQRASLGFDESEY